jgi:K+-transporting ATPase c subunit
LCWIRSNYFSWQLWMFFFRMFSLCSAIVSVLVTVLGKSPVKKSENGRLVRFKKGQIVGARLTWASVIKTATLLGVSKATVSRVTLAYTNYGKTTSEKRNRERNSTLTWIDHRIFRRTVSKNHRTTAAQMTAELSTFFLKTLFPQNCLMWASQIQYSWWNCNC